MINSQEYFQTDSSVHNINTRNKNRLHRPIRGSCVQKSIFYAGIKILNSLSTIIFMYMPCIFIVYYLLSVPVEAPGGEKWEHLKSGESNGKLPLRTCPGCSVPEPYQSPD